MAYRSGETHWDRYVALPQIRFERHFGNRVMRCLADRPGNLQALLEAGTAASPLGEAVVFGEERLSYPQLTALVERVAAGLVRKGVARGDRVAVLLPNCSDYVVLIFAIARIGAILVPLNIRETASEIAYILNDCTPSLVVLDSSLTASLPAAPDLPEQTGVAVLSGRIGTALGAEGPAVAVAVEEHDLAAILYTSGTTGRPKGAMLTHLNIVHSVMHYQLVMGVGRSDRSVLAVPISHVTGLVALVATILGAGGTLIIMPAFNAAQFLRLSERERMTHTLIVPAMFNLCLLQPEMDSTDQSAWRVAGYGGAIMPQVTIERIAQKLPQLGLYNCYGATETCSPAAIMPPVHAAARSNQVGLEVPCGDIVVMDGHGREVAAGEAGEIWIGGPMVAKGYWRNPLATEQEFVGGYWRSGDIGSRDEQGFIRIIDRLKDVINRGGYKIYASEVENVLLEVPGVVEAAVVSFPCPVLGERVHAHVAVRDGTGRDEIAAHCRAHLADYKVPEEIFLVDALPRNANGKVLKRLLRQA